MHFHFSVCKENGSQSEGELSEGEIKVEKTSLSKSQRVIAKEDSSDDEETKRAIQMSLQELPEEKRKEEIVEVPEQRLSLLDDPRNYGTTPNLHFLNPQELIQAKEMYSLISMRMDFRDVMLFSMRINIEPFPLQILPLFLH